MTWRKLTGDGRLLQSYKFSPEGPYAAGQKDLNYSHEYARELLSQAVAEEKRECVDPSHGGIQNGGRGEGTLSI